MSAVTILIRPTTAIDSIKKSAEPLAPICSRPLLKSELIAGDYKMPRHLLIVAEHCAFDYRNIPLKVSKGEARHKKWSIIDEFITHNISSTTLVVCVTIYPPNSCWRHRRLAHWLGRCEKTIAASMRSMRPVASRPAGRNRRQSILCFYRRASFTAAPGGWGRHWR